MDEIITIDDWWDGPTLGLTYYDNEIYIYQGFYYEGYDLYPVTKEEYEQIMQRWDKWCQAVKQNQLEDFYASQEEEPDFIERIIEKAKLEKRRSLHKYGEFKGTYDWGYIPIDYQVEWTDIRPVFPTYTIESI